MPVGEVTDFAELLDPGVRAVELMLTTGCNLRCAYCYQRRGVVRTMEPAVLDAAIRHLVTSRLGEPKLVLYGGEPLLAADLVRRALDKARTLAPAWMKPELEILTNGIRLDEEMTRFLVGRNVFITVSFDGIAPAQDERSPGSFDMLDRLLVRLKRDHPKHFRRRVAVKATLTSRNVPFLAASFRYFLSRGLRDVELVPVLPDEPGWNRRSSLDLDRQLGDVVKVSFEEFRRSGEIPFRPFRRGSTDATMGGAPACSCGSRGLLSVDVDGALAPCAAFARSTLGPQPKAIRHVMKSLGGLRVTDRNLLEALVRREKRARRLSFLAGKEKRQGPQGPCARCPVLPSCFVCPIAVAYGGGRVPAFHCDVNRLFARHRDVFRRMIA
ncbi:MAG: radical SAM protein [Acidithiobacillales bacterium]